MPLVLFSPTTIRSRRSSDQENDQDLFVHTGGGRTAAEGSRLGTSIATALEGKVKVEANPPIPATKFVEASGKSFNTIPPSDFSFFEIRQPNAFDA
jgi:hypothetical protein